MCHRNMANIFNHRHHREKPHKSPRTASSVLSVAFPGDLCGKAFSRYPFFFLNSAMKLTNASTESCDTAL